MIDLHMHSTFSDGSLTPEELVKEAERQKLTAIALTDHDTTSGLSRFLSAGEKSSVRTLPGVEISADFSPGTMHMLGYFVDPLDETLERKLKWIREGRESRNQEILKKLRDLGCDIEWKEVAGYAGEDVVGRPHFAQALLAHDYVSTKNEAFEKYLGKGKAAYADRRRFTPEDSIALIRSAGGVPVLAHPFTLQVSKDELRKLVGELAEQGLQGIEVYYSEHKKNAVERYSQFAKDFGLVMSGGSDFHGAMAPDIKLGRGFGNLRVPDELLPALEARRPTG